MIAGQDWFAPAPRSTVVSWSIAAALALIAAWLAASVPLVNLEFGDGYSTVANARYFLGTSAEYFWQRGPLMAIVVAPGEWLARVLELSPLDVRPHHAVMILLHMSYLLAVWRILTRRFGPSLASALSFLAAIPTVVFFSYAPFISHDIFPGLLVVCLLLVCDAFLARPNLRDWLLFLALTLALGLLKQTFALVPVALLASRILVAVPTSALAREWRPLLLLGLAGVLAGLLCWCGYASVLGGRFPDIGFWLRPLAMVDAINGNYGGLAELDKLVYPWLYLRNLSAYGLVAMTLVIPGIALAIWRGNVFMRQAAVFWALLVIAMMLMPFREVRYLAFLAPMTALLIVPVMRMVVSGPRRYQWLLAFVLVIDLARASLEAGRIIDPYYRRGVISFFEPLAAAVGPRTPIFFGIGWLSFVSPEDDAFFGDPFHRITEMQIEQIRVLNNWTPERVFRIKLPAIKAAIARHPNGVFLIQTVLLSRNPPFRPGNLAGLPQSFLQVLATADQIDFVRSGNDYRVAQRPELPVMLVDDEGGHAIVLGSAPLDVIRHFARFEGAPEHIRLSVLRPLRVCELAGCRQFPE